MNEADRYLREHCEWQTSDPQQSVRSETEPLQKQVPQVAEPRKKCSFGRYCLAAVVCLGMYVLIQAVGYYLFGWRRGGGYFFQMLTFGLLVGVWRSITR